MAITLKLSKVIISLMICMLPIAAADYILQVRTWSYSNSGSRLANGQCCVFQDIRLNICQSSACNNVFYYCLRDLGSTEADCSGGKTSQINYNGDHIDFKNPTVFGLPNPLPLPGLTREWRGVQFFLEVRHMASETVTGGVIGTVIFNISYGSLLVGIESGQISRQTTAINIVFSFRVVCAENYYGQNCSQFCKESCIWDSEFAGESCNQIDECIGVDCGEDEQCVDGTDNYTCICYPGYADKNCDMNVCHVLNVSHSTNNLKMVQTINLMAVFIGIIGVLVIIVILLLLMVGATCLIIRALKKTAGNNHAHTNDTDTLKLVPDPEEGELHADYSLEMKENTCYRVVPHTTQSRESDNIYYNVTEQLEDDYF